MSFQFVSDHREYLKLELEIRKSRRPYYSQRALARDIEMSPSALNEYLNGRIRLSPERITQISKFIGLNQEQRKHWIDLINMKYAKSQELKKISELRVQSRIQSQNHSISIEQFKIISEWHHLAFIQLIMLNAKKYSDLKVAASALNISLYSLRLAVKRLESLSLLALDEAGHYVVSSTFRIGDSTPSMAIRQYHKEMIGKALEAIENQPMRQRFASTTMVALPKNEAEKILLELKNLAHNFLNPYMNNCKDSEKDSIYCLTLQFFDLLKEKKIK